MIRQLSLIIITTVLANNAIAKSEAEFITFVSSDLTNFVTFSTVRTQYSSYALQVSKSGSLDRFLYISPNDYKLDTKSNKSRDIIKFQGGNYAILTEDVDKEAFKPDDDGVYTYNSWKGEKTAKGNFGYWQNNGFDRFAIAWVLPSNLEIISYDSNRKGEWVLRGNTLAFFAQNTNDLTFSLKVRGISHGLLKSLEKDLGSEVELEQDGDQVKLTLADTILFPPGGSEISPAGMTLLGKISTDLGKRDGVRLVVQGHTDNTPITGALADRFATNWELSSARAIAVVRYLADQGISGEFIEARALGEFQPRSSNASPAGRAKNRRIEILISQAN